MSTRLALAGLLASLLCVGSLAHAASAAPRRVATLVPFAGAALAGHPESVIVVASVRIDPRAPVPDGVVDLGSPHSPNLEKLAEARAEIVVTDAQMHGPLTDALTRTGAKVFAIDSSSLDATFGGLEKLGAEIGIGPAIQADVARTREELAAQRIPKPIPVLALFGAPGSFFVLTDKTWLGDLLQAQGFKNVAPVGTTGGRFPGFAPLNDEVILGLSPELVLIVAHGNPEGVLAAFAREMETRPALRSVRDSAKRGVHTLDPALFSANPGLDMPRAARALRELAESPARP